MPKRKTAFDADKLINCEICHHFTGAAYSFRFECAKGHQPENTYNFKRASCSDNKPMTPDELIFERFKFTAKHTGDQELKKHQAQARRIVTGLRNAISEQGFGKFLDSDQITAIKEAAEALELLGDRIERAGKLAQKYQKDEKEKFERERHLKLLTISTDYFGEATKAHVLEVCEDLHAFSGSEGTQWFRSRSRTGQGWINIYRTDLGRILVRYRAESTENTYEQVKLVAAEYLEGLQLRDPMSDTASLQDFEEFRKYRNLTQKT